MGKVIQMPVRGVDMVTPSGGHVRAGGKPKCGVCSRELPDLRGFSMIAPDEMKGARLLEASILVLCLCGAKWTIASKIAE